MIGITINKLIFNNGREIDLSPSDIVVFVGPNNMGKSQSLRDIYSLASYNNTGVVIKDVELGYHNIDKLKAEVQRLSIESSIGQNIYYKGYNYSIHYINLDGITACPLKVDGEIRKYLISMAKTEERLNTSDPKTMVNYGQPQNCPLQYATISDNKNSMSKIFQKIFSKHIYCEDRGSTMLTLHMGNEIRFCMDGMSPQDVVDEQYKRICELPKVHEQGDGIRSLAGLLLNLMMPNYSIFLIDEPEAFLHPPQARVLGENLPGQLGDKQAFISTHSIELIKGLLTKAHQRVKIVRITRDGTINPVHYLPPRRFECYLVRPDHTSFQYIEWVVLSSYNIM